jgi:hypothetical protein
MKSIFSSKTVWFNALTVLTVIAGGFGYTPDQELVATTGTILLALSPLVNIVLRIWFTKKAIAL